MLYVQQATPVMLLVHTQSQVLSSEDCDNPSEVTIVGVCGCARVRARVHACVCICMCDMAKNISEIFRRRGKYSLHCPRNLISR